MSKRLERVISFLLALVLVIGMLPANALSVFAADDEASTVATDYTEADVGKSFEFKGSSAKPTGTIPTGSYWEGPVLVKSEAKCGNAEHEHTHACYTTCGKDEH